jgi:hypothetical protein
VTLVIDGVFDCNGGLEDQTLEEVAFVKGELPALRGGDYEFGEKRTVTGEEVEARAAIARLGHRCGRNFPVQNVLRGEERAIQFEFTDGDPCRLLQHIGQLDGGMNGTGGFEQGLEADDLFCEWKAALIYRVGLLDWKH